MSTLSKGPGVPFVGGVESFVYQDTSDAPLNSEAVPYPAQRSAEKTVPGDGVPRISEQELSRLISEARAEGIREGERRTGATTEQELAKERLRMAEIVAAFQLERNEYYSKVEVELVHFALAIAAKILHREAQVDRMLVAGLVKVMLEKLQQGTRVTVRVRPEAAESWRHYFHDNPTIQVAEDFALTQHDCMVETELGIADLGLDAQLKEIEKGFFDLLAQRPESK